MHERFDRVREIGRADGVYSTVTDRGVLRYHAATATITEEPAP